MPLRDQPALLLAPHLVHPPRNGADVATVGLARSLSRRLPAVDVVGASEVVTYVDGEPSERRPYPNRLRHRHRAALRVLLRRTHYLLERFVTPAAAAQARAYLALPGYGLVYHSFLTTAALADLPDPGRRHVVFTHNDEFAWFEDMQASARNPVSRAVARRSLAWLTRFLTRHRDHLHLLHVTEADGAGWERRVAGLTSSVVPLGVDVRGKVAPPLARGGEVRLLFSGALGVQMNLDALICFAERFAPAIRSTAGTFRLDVVGSTPLPEIRALCEVEGWHLAADVSEDEMDRVFQDATFSLLPFPYATGAKLKLLKSLSYGVPVLATAAVGAQSGHIVAPSLMSDTPEDWAAHVASTKRQGLSTDDRLRLRAIAQANSWDASAAHLLNAVHPS